MGLGAAVDIGLRGGGEMCKRAATYKPAEMVDAIGSEVKEAGKKRGNENRWRSFLEKQERKGGG